MATFAILYTNYSLMNEAIKALKPTLVWNNFTNLNAVPRPSKKEEKVIAFVCAFAERLGLHYRKDAVGNVVIEKPATTGMENRRPVILQAHLDMVHQKNADKEFDFATQGIEMLIDGDWVKANGTTLGADNGMGVAAAMAVLEAQDLAHPPLEVLFTIDEEAGMTGVENLQPGFVKGEILMNLDTEDDDELSIGCAGGMYTTVDWHYGEEPVQAETVALTLMVKGLKGGHSGMDIIYGRGNANKIMNRLLWEVYEKYGARLHRLEGGSLHNAIPRESVAVMVVPQQQRGKLIEDWEERAAALQAEFATTDPQLMVSWQETVLPDSVMKPEEQVRLLWAIQCCHDGIRRMSPDVEDLVETSNNLAKIKAGDGHLEVLTLQRSDRESAKYDMAHSVAAPFLLWGAEVEHSHSYPGWKLDPQAPMLAMMRALYEELFEEKPRVVACHAGLECGLLGKNYPHLEMISFGPTIQHPHSPDERVHIGSVAKFWTILTEALQRIPEKA